MKRKSLLFPACLLLWLTGCTSHPQTSADGQKWNENWTKIGTAMGIEVPGELTLLDSKETLAADGLYYATWVTGDSVPYQNNEGETIDLYDAQLYLLTSEAVSGKKAQDSCDAWLSAAKENYEVHTEDTVTFNGQSYTQITYDCTGEGNPYARGVSVFGVRGTTAVCAEFTCLENYAQDPKSLLAKFLDGCHFIAD